MKFLNDSLTGFQVLQVKKGSTSLSLVGIPDNLIFII